MSKRNSVYASGSLKRMAATSVYKRATPNKLHGFWRGPKQQPPFVPLGRKRIVQ
jgi:hypothetical protein